MSRRRYEHSVSFSKAEPETHAWSFHEACVAAQRDIEKEYGLDWRIVEIEFDDDGRITSTDYDEFTGRKAWHCTHTVVVMYSVKPVFATEDKRKDAMSKEIIKTENTIKIKYNMINDTFEYNE